MSELRANLSSGYADLAKASEAEGLTPTGAAWLAKVLDPFHDIPLELRGIPDQTDCLSTVRIFNKSISVGFPTGWTASDNWSLAVSFFPVADYQTGHGIVLQPERGLINITNVNLPADVGPVMACAFIPESVTSVKKCPFPSVGTVNVAPNGTYNLNNMWDTADVVDNKHYYNSMNLLSPWWSEAFGSQGPIPGGNTRLVCLAFEVINTTVEQHKGGVITCYRNPIEYDSDGVFNIAEFTDSTNVTPGIIKKYEANKINAYRGAPLWNTSTMQNLPGTVQWPAERGAYCVATFDPEAMIGFDHSATRKGTIVCANDYNYSTGLAFPGWCDKLGCYAQFDVKSDDASYHMKYNPVYTHRSSDHAATIPSGIVISGLSRYATFQINVRYGFETVPPIWDQSSVVQAKQSAVYDPAALALYAKTIRLMPPGVPVDMNPLGEWFSLVMNWVKQNAAGIGGVIGSLIEPGGGTALGTGIGAGLGQIAGLAGSYNQSLLDAQKRAKFNSKI